MFQHRSLGSKNVTMKASIKQIGMILRRQPRGTHCTNLCFTKSYFHDGLMGRKAKYETNVAGCKGQYFRVL